MPNKNMRDSILVIGGTTLLGVLAACIYPSSMRRHEQQRQEPPSVVAESTAGDAGVEVQEEPSPFYVTDNDSGDQVQPPPGLAKPMPLSPFPEQKRPPCNKRHVELNGGCWAEMAAPPTPGLGCGEDEYENKGKCYAWVRDPKRIPRSLEKQKPGK